MPSGGPPQIRPIDPKQGRPERPPQRRACLGGPAPLRPCEEDFCDVHNIDSSTDYRLITSSEEEDRRVYIYPNGKEEQKLLERKFHRLCKGESSWGFSESGRRLALHAGAFGRVCPKAPMASVDRQRRCATPRRLSDAARRRPNRCVNAHALS